MGKLRHREVKWLTQGLTLFLFGINTNACTIFQPYFSWKYLLCLLIFGKCRVSKGFFGGSAGKESACNAGDPGSIPGLGRSVGEGIGYPPQDSWTSLVVPLVKNPPAMWEKCFLVLHCSHSLLKDYNFYLRLISSHLGNEKFSHFQTKTWNLSLEILVLILVVYYDFWVRSEYNAPYAKAVSMSRLLNVIRALYTLSSKRYTYLLFMVTFEKLSGKIFFLFYRWENWHQRS